MPFKDVRQFITKIDELGELKTVNGADWNLEIGAISELAITSEKSPAVLFDDIKGYKKGFRVLSNPVRNYKRVAIALDLPHDKGPLDVMRAWRAKSKILRPVDYKIVNSSHAEENVDENDNVDLYKFPSPLWHRKDGGRYIGTADLVINRELDSDWVNAAVYRCQVMDKNTLGIFIAPGHHGDLIAKKYWEKGKSCPIAVTCGQDPALVIAGAAALPHNVSEYNYAGAIRGERVEVFTGKYTGLPIPTSAEIVIEGDFVSPKIESRIEGPFGEWTGYYGSKAVSRGIIKVKRVSFRTEPILMGAPPVRGDSIGLPFNTVAVWDALESSGIPNVKAVWNHIGASLLVVIAIKQAYAGHSKQAAFAALGSKGGSHHGTFIVVVDDDIDPSNLEEVMWAVTTRCDPSKSIDIVRGCWTSGLDTRVSPEMRRKGDYVTSRAIIDACRPYEWMEEYPEVSAIESDLKHQTIERWGREIGL
jgi:UbiD family decarboxylase